MSSSRRRYCGLFIVVCVAAELVRSFYSGSQEVSWRWARVRCSSMGTRPSRSGRSHGLLNFDGRRVRRLGLWMGAKESCPLEQPGRGEHQPAFGRQDLLADVFAHDLPAESLFEFANFEEG